MIGSDGSSLAPQGHAGEGQPHPRSYGTFPRVLGHYVREQRLLTLPQAVHKMTGLPARRLGLRDRGVVTVETRGYKQDGTLVCVFRRRVMVPRREHAGDEYPSFPTTT